MTAAPALYQVPRDRVDGAWSLAGHLLRPAMERCGEMPAADLFRALMEGRFVLWLAASERVEAAAVTEIAETTAGRVLCIVACGGADRRRWLHFVRNLEEYGRQRGCVLSRIYGRRGWQRALPEYRPQRVIIEKAL